MAFRDELTAKQAENERLARENRELEEKLAAARQQSAQKDDPVEIRWPGSEYDTRTPGERRLHIASTAAGVVILAGICLHGLTRMPFDAVGYTMMTTVWAVLGALIGSQLLSPAVSGVFVHPRYGRVLGPRARLLFTLGFVAAAVGAFFVTHSF